MLTPARPCAPLYGHGFTFTAMVILVRPCAPLHSHAHATAVPQRQGSISIPGHAPAETSGRSPQIPNQYSHASSLNQRPVHSNLRIQPVSPPSLRQRPVNSNLRIRPTHSNSPRRRGGHGHAVASRRGDVEGPAFKPARRPAPAAQGVDPRRIWTGWIQQKSADAAPDRAGRMTDHAGQARRHASAWVRSLHFPALSRIS